VILPFPSSAHCAPMTTTFGPRHSGPKPLLSTRMGAWSEQRPFRQRAGLIVGTGSVSGHSRPRRVTFASALRSPWPRGS